MRLRFRQSAITDSSKCGRHDLEVISRGYTLLVAAHETVSVQWENMLRSFYIFSKFATLPSAHKGDLHV